MVQSLSLVFLLSLINKTKPHPSCYTGKSLTRGHAFLLLFVNRSCAIERSLHIASGPFDRGAVLVALDCAALSCDIQIMHPFFNASIDRSIYINSLNHFRFACLIGCCPRYVPRYKAGPGVTHQSVRPIRSLHLQSRPIVIGRACASRSEKLWRKFNYCYMKSF